ncbi:DUF3010 family protein [Teredinibacter franksiae]|jgi:Protein of unknown function (DUF3010).|uniref:DUF3010 family protein n=1 Tax=Teredinibacter franksiae TaxID=2761453 RepID=UPI001626774C|nr:DUF3010 family protein [Teredinibacter franksiae]
MKVCGIEIKGKEAVICLLSSDNGLFEISDCRVRSLTLKDPDTSEGLLGFQTTLAKLAEDYKVEKIIIKERPKKGKFAGGAEGFKMEAAIQLIDTVQVSLMSASRSKVLLKAKPLPISFSETDLKAFQETAFKTAYAALIDINEVVETSNDRV